VIEVKEMMLKTEIQNVKNKADYQNSYNFQSEFIQGQYADHNYGNAVQDQFQCLNGYEYGNDYYVPNQQAHFVSEIEASNVYYSNSNYNQPMENHGQNPQEQFEYGYEPNTGYPPYDYQYYYYEYDYDFTNQPQQSKSQHQRETMPDSYNNNYCYDAYYRENVNDYYGNNRYYAYYYYSQQGDN